MGEKRIVSRRRTLVLSALGVLVAALIAWYWPPAHRWLFGAGPPPNQLLVSGNVEAHESVLSFTDVQAPITRLPFDEGKVVAAGTVLAQVDDAIYRKQLQIDEANLQVSLRQVSVERSDVAAARSTIVSDQLDLAEKRLDLTRDAGRLKIGAASHQAYDLAHTAAGQSAADLARDRALLKIGRASCRGRV